MAPFLTTVWCTKTFLIHLTTLFWTILTQTLSLPVPHFVPFHFPKSFTNRSQTYKKEKKKRVLDKNMRYNSGLVIDHAEHAKQGPNIYERRE